LRNHAAEPVSRPTAPAFDGEMNELALFAGAGGGILGGVLLGWSTVCAVEIDPYCRGVLLRRQRDGLLPMFPIWDDARTFDGRPWRGLVDVVSAGFPCQPFSVAGRRLGVDDERNMWPETIRIIREVGPRFALLENVPGLLVHRYFGTILGDLAEAGYDAEWGMFSAAEVGAPHIRNRLWILAGRNDDRSEWNLSTVADAGRLSVNENELPRSKTEAASCESSEDVAHSEIDGWNARRTGDASQVQEWRESHRGSRQGDVSNADSDAADGVAIARRQRRFWIVEPRMGRVADGVAHRVDRLKALGNGQVPAVVVLAWTTLLSRLRGAGVRHGEAHAGGSGVRGPGAAMVRPAALQGTSTVNVSDGSCRNMT
jgi:DNA (cytosine-5)-methyltransferase 1